MSFDKKTLFEVIKAMENISQKFEKEVINLKKKVNYSDLTIGLEECHKKFYEKTLKPIFLKKKEITKEEIEDYVKLKNLKYARNTITCYLSGLSKNDIIKIKSNQIDKRKKLYIKNFEFEGFM